MNPGGGTRCSQASRWRSYSLSELAAELGGMLDRNPREAARVLGDALGREGVEHLAALFDAATHLDELAPGTLDWAIGLIDEARKWAEQ
jgi:hypothetical protein